MTVARAAAIFLVTLLYLVLLLLLLPPRLRAEPGLHPVTHWYLISYLLFPPMVAYAFWQVRIEGAGTFSGMLNSLGVRPMTRRDWRYSIAGVFAVLIVTGLIYTVWNSLAAWQWLPPLQHEPWCIDMSPLNGPQRWLLLAWIPALVLNVVGEELLWRGYIQSRMKVPRECQLSGWQISSVFWFGFHAPFGIHVMILTLPLMLILPFVFGRTRNTSAAMVIHTMFNGPAFLASAFGLLP